MPSITNSNSSSFLLFLAMVMTVLSLMKNIAVVEGHSRWKCPAPRDANDAEGQHITFDNTGNKDGPCGPNTGTIYGYNGITPLAPGPQTFVWEESIAHKGAPYRINLLNKSGDIIATLLDHIPHDDTTKTTMREHFFTPFKMTIDIPDVECEECSLQLLFVMTDKTTNCGTEYCNYYADDDNCIGHTDPDAGVCTGAVPTSGPCKNADTCFSVYHSCIDVQLTGSTPMGSFKGGDLQPEDWPYKGNSNANYTSEATEWKDQWIVGVPDHFTTQAGKDLCPATSNDEINTNINLPYEYDTDQLARVKANPQSGLFKQELESIMEHLRMTKEHGLRRHEN